MPANTVLADGVQDLEIGDKIRIRRTVYPELRKKMVAKIADMDYNFYGENKHRFWVSLGENNYYFDQREVEPYEFNMRNHNKKGK
jgi:hypothetical protein